MSSRIYMNIVIKQTEGDDKSMASLNVVKTEEDLHSIPHKQRMPTQNKSLK